METLQSSKGEMWLTAVKAYISCNCYGKPPPCMQLAQSAREWHHWAQIWTLNHHCCANSLWLSKLCLLLLQIQQPSPMQSHSLCWHLPHIFSHYFIWRPFRLSLMHTCTSQRYDQYYLQHATEKDTTQCTRANPERVATKLTGWETHWWVNTHGIQSTKLRSFIIVACFLSCRAKSLQLTEKDRARGGRGSAVWHFCGKTKATF